ncbi:MAG: protein kinase [Pseudomonadales bacterium]|nr:protein kinase [Pseudomonadales bacterium]
MMSKLFSIRNKLFGLVFSAFLFLILAIYWQIGQKSESVANTVIERSLTQSSTILDTRIESRFRFIKEIANAIAQDGRILPLVFDEDSLTLQDQSIEFEAAYDFDILFFLNAAGDILARSDQPDAIGINLAGRSSLFDEPLSGKEATGFIVSNGKLMQTVVTPVFDNVAGDIVRGAVALAYDLSKATANEIVALTESEIGFFVFTRDQDGIFNGVELSYMTDEVLAKSLMDHFQQQPSSWFEIVEKDAQDFRKDFQVNGEIEHSIIRPINSKDGTRLGFVVAMRSSSELTQPFTEIQQRLLLVGLICLGIASLLAILMALGLSRPILRMVEVTKLIEEGNYAKFSLKKKPRDEIGILHSALLRMGNSLQEKANLEAFLADIANEADDDTRTLPKGAVHFEEEENLDRTILVKAGMDAANSQDDEDKTVINSEAVGGHQQNQATEQIVDGRYKLIKPLGSGGLGSVYLAQDLELDEKIAIKVMQSQTIESLQGLNFKEEIRLARKITHPNIVRTFDFGNWQNTYYITMEFAQGIGLGKFINRQKSMDVSIGLGICKQICFAMIAAHQMGIIHRDLKPSNMIINRRGVVQIMDFGLAMQVSSAKDSNASSDGTVMGTPKYMAPEQFMGSDNLDERTDIYAIGVVMYQLFSGRPPFSASGFAEIAELHLGSPVPKMQSKLELPAELEGIILKALAKDPQERFQTVRELLVALNGIP